MRLTTIATTVLLTATLLGIGPSPSQGAGPAASRANVAAAEPNPTPAVVLPIDYLADFVVDETNGHLIFAQADEGPVVVTDLQGANPQTIPALTGAYDLALSDDGLGVWVALSATHTIARLDLADLSIDTWSAGMDPQTSAAACPESVFTSSGLVWFAFSCDQQWHSLRALDPATGTLYDTTPTPKQLYASSYFTTPAMPGRVFIAQHFSSPALTSIRTTGLPTPDYTIDATLYNGPVSTSIGYDALSDRLVTGAGQGFKPSDIADSTARKTYPASGTLAVRHDGLMAFAAPSKTTIVNPGGDSVLREYAINASNYRFWPRAIRTYIDDLVAGADGPRGKDFNMRWVASMVAEATRIMVRGGVYIYPRDSRKGYENGRLRLVYEANPIALVFEQAGGGATDGVNRILDIMPTSLHQRVPLVFGSADKVQRIARYHTDAPSSRETSPLFSERGLFRV